MADTWTARLWRAAEPIYAAILQHPFLAALTDGTLPESSFAYYLAQDAHYLRDYARALAVVGAKAPTHADAAMFGRHAAETAEVELALHATLLPELGIDPAELDAIASSPTTTAYTSYLLASVSGGSFAEGLAAVLPCYWIYQRVGEALLQRGSPDARYQRWIDTYAGDAFAETVAQVLAVADRCGLEIGAADDRRAQRHFAATARYEWMFWDAAWREESWPLSDALGTSPGESGPTMTRLDHVTITAPAAEFAERLAFYDAALGALGLVRLAELVDEEEEDPAVEAAAWGIPDGGGIVWLVTGERATTGLHIRLQADSRLQVEALHAAALRAGGAAHTAPRRWVLYRRGEFNAIVADPAGNLLEAVAAE